MGLPALEPQTRFWVGVASWDHVQRGLAGHFCQVCHGKAQPLRRMAAGDWLIHYSPKKQFEGKEPYQHFTAIGRVRDEAVYQVEMFPGFFPFRRNIDFLLDARHVAIQPLLDSLDFITDRRHWGSAFRFGHFAIQRADFERIATRMLAAIPPEPLSSPRQKGLFDEMERP